MGDTVATPPLRIVIADGAELVRRGIRDVLAPDPRFEVVAETSRALDVADVCLQTSPDIVFLGLGRETEAYGGELAALSALRQTLRLHPSARVIVLVDGEAPDEVLEPVRAGAVGVLLRDASATTLLQAIRDVAAGGAALDPRLARNLFQHLLFAPRSPALATQGHELDPAVLRMLSRREQEVLQALARGCRNKEIGAELGVSVGTVKTHLRHIYRKLNVTDRTAAVLLALQVRLPEAA